MIHATAVHEHTHYLARTIHGGGPRALGSRHIEGCKDAFAQQERTLLAPGVGISAEKVTRRVDIIDAVPELPCFAAGTLNQRELAARPPIPVVSAVFSRTGPGPPAAAPNPGAATHVIRKWI